MIAIDTDQNLIRAKRRKGIILKLVRKGKPRLSDFEIWAALELMGLNQEANGECDGC
jgi:hypothetical protein